MAELYFAKKAPGKVPLFDITNTEGLNKEDLIELHVSAPVLDRYPGRWQKALGSRVFVEWWKGLDPQFDPSEIWIDEIDLRGDEVLFAYIRTKVKQKTRLQRVMLRGNTSAVLLILSCDGKKYAVLVEQPRLATGEWGSIEIIAGMLDNGTFSGVAVREVAEETGVVIREEDLVLLQEKAVALSCGASDERVSLYRVEKEVSAAELRDIQGRIAGNPEEGEKTRVLVVPIEEVYPLICGDAKSLLAYLLYTR